MSSLRQYVVVGRAQPTASNPVPQIYRMRIFAPDSVRARSQFWSFMNRSLKIKRNRAQLLSCTELLDKNPNSVKNYAIWLKYLTNKGTYNLLMQYRGTKVSPVVERLKNDMAGRYHVRPDNINIVSIKTLSASEVKNPKILNFTKSTKIALPSTTKVARTSNKQYKSTFQRKSFSRPL